MGDRVRIKLERIKYYEYDINGPKNEHWVSEAPYLFKRGRIFTVTRVHKSGSVNLDDGIGGAWATENLEPCDLMDSELFEI